MLNRAVSEKLAEQGIDQSTLTGELANNFADYLKNPGDITTTPLKSLLSAKASALPATTSCATFFQEPGTSGFINPLFAVQSIYHLRDAGLITAAEEVESKYMERMAEVVDPYNPSYTGRDMVEDLLTRRIGTSHDIFSAAAD